MSIEKDKDTKELAKEIVNAWNQPLENERDEEMKRIDGGCGKRVELIVSLLFGLLLLWWVMAAARGKATSPKRRQEKTDKPNGRREREDKRVELS